MKRKLLLNMRVNLYFSTTNKPKQRSGLFDVTMSAYHGAEVCEIVGILILYQISLKCNKNSMGLYRHDGLTVF